MGILSSLLQDWDIAWGDDAIELLLVDGVFYPVDAVSASRLERICGVAHFPEADHDKHLDSVSQHGYCFSPAD